MRQKFEIKAIDETSVKVTVVIDSERYVLTREEVSRFKASLQNAVHKMLREEGYDVKQIKLK